MWNVNIINGVGLWTVCL